MRVPVEVEETTLLNDRGLPIASVCVRCSRCDHAVEVFGTSDRSVRRGCLTLREECPNAEENYYTADE